MGHHIDGEVHYAPPGYFQEETPATGAGVCKFARLAAHVFNQRFYLIMVISRGTFFKQDRSNTDDTGNQTAGSKHQRIIEQLFQQGFADVLGHPCFVGNTDIGIGGDFHTYPAGRSGHAHADHKADGGLP